MNTHNLINSRFLALACVVFLVLVLTACGGGGGGSGGMGASAGPAPTGPACATGSVLDDGVCRPVAERIDARAPTPFVENGRPVELEVVLFKPPGEDRFPTLVFHHGSTGNGSNPSLFAETFTSSAVVEYFVERGWMVAFPQRRGRGRSDGLYDEGFQPDRSAYSCEKATAIAGAERALDDLDAAADWLRARADVDSTRLLVGGSSRGGILAVAHVARRPDLYLGAINFVGGWLSEGCGDHLSVNRRLFKDGAGFPGPTLWLYGVNDSFYSLGYSRANFAAYTDAGGLGTFHELHAGPGRNGHFIVNYPRLWEAEIQAFLEQI